MKKENVLQNYGLNIINHEKDELGYTVCPIVYYHTISTSCLLTEAA
jgi:hypothetical protein